MLKDRIVKQVIEKLTRRSEAGDIKYGETMDQANLTPRQWLIHLQEELLDGANYIEKLLDIMDGINAGVEDE